MAFVHQIDTTHGNYLPPAGVLLSGPLPAVISLGPDDEWGYPLWDVPTFTGEEVGGASLIDDRTAMVHYHRHNVDHEINVTLAPLRCVCRCRSYPEQLSPILLARFLVPLWD